MGAAEAAALLFVTAQLRLRGPLLTGGEATPAAEELPQFQLGFAETAPTGESWKLTLLSRFGVVPAETPKPYPKSYRAASANGLTGDTGRRGSEMGAAEAAALLFVTAQLQRPLLAGGEATSAA
ncbi:hypothetical protein [Puniceicoccus vermicola]|uniref:Uncharacterized protein n=1 Tax=Puniceicoccus vermicola TaxID=388746 RepID=A0A7X1E647_9BACT|nr:hypothetical protein [Puniceicoccus vermicola]MBC2603801.1 hypothetical protein [Puniceicoccus vermicola]